MLNKIRVGLVAEGAPLARESVLGVALVTIALNLRTTIRAFVGHSASANSAMTCP